MNFKTTAILLGLVLVGGAAVWLMPAKTASKSADKSVAATTTRYVLDPRPKAATDVRRVVFERPGKPRLVFERAEKKDDSTPAAPAWRMVEPVSAEVEGYLVDNVARLATDLRYEQTLEVGASGISEADAGLDAPRAKLTIADKDGKEYTVEIGKKAPLSTNTYVRVPGEHTIKVASRDFSTELTKKASEFRTKGLYRKLARQDAKNLSVSYESKKYDLTRGSDGVWVVNSPYKAFGAKDAITKWVNDFAALRVADYVDDAPASMSMFGFDAPFMSIAVTTEQKKQIKPEGPPASEPAEPAFETITKSYSLEVGGFSDLEKKRRYVKLADQPWVAEVDVESLKKLTPSDAWRDPAVARIKAADVTGLELGVAGASFALHREGRAWAGSGDLAKLEPAAVTSLVEALEDAKANEFIDEPGAASEYGLDSPRERIAITTRGSVEPIVLRIGSATPSGRNVYVRVEGRRSVLVISAKHAERLLVDPMSLRSRAIFSLRPDQIRAIRLQRADVTYDIDRATPESDWTMHEPAEAPVDPAGIRVLSNNLAQLRAKNVVGKDAAAYGLDDPALTITFSIERPAASQPAASQPGAAASGPVRERVEHTLRVSRKARKTYCVSDGGPYVFELDESIWLSLKDELINRQLLDLEADEIAGLRIEAPGGTLEFARKDGKWTYPPDPFVALSQKAVNDLVTELAALRVARYIKYDAPDLSEEWINNAPVTLTITMSDGAIETIKIDQVRRGELPRMAAWLGPRREFMMRRGDVDKLLRGLDAYVPVETPDETTPPPPAPPTPGTPR